MSSSRTPLRLLSTGEEDLGGEPHKDIGLLRRLVPFVRPHWVLLAVAFSMMPAAAVASLVQPYLLKLGIDAMIVHKSGAELLRVVVMFGVAVVAEFVTRFVQSYTLQLSGQRALADLRSQTFRHIHRLALKYIDRTPVGRIVTRVTNDVDALGELFGSGAVTAIADVLFLVGIVVLMVVIDWELSLVAFVALPPLGLAVNAFRKYARTAFRQIRARIAQLNAYLAEQVQGITVVQALGREDRCAKEFGEINDRYRQAHRRAIRADALLYSVVESVSVACVAMILWYAGTKAALFDDPTRVAAYIGTVVAFYEYIQRFFIPIRDLSTKYTIVQSSLASAERIFSLLDVDELDAPGCEPRAVAASTPREGVVFHDVSFAYRPGVPVLQGINLVVRPGETVALVGATGSGKSTLAALLLRLYEPEDGSVVVQGKEVRSYARHELRGLFSVIPQDVFLFSGTVLENVAIGDAAPDRARAERAVNRVGLEKLLAARGGLETRVEERGANFSAGEKQLLAFARALYRDPPFLILDEATASVDSDTEARLQAGVAELTRGRTSLIIAHRLSTVRDASRIVVLHRGRIAEQGTHAALLAGEGIYARLHRLQFADRGG